MPDVTTTYARLGVLVWLLATLSGCAPDRPSEQISRPGQTPPDQPATDDPPGTSARPGRPARSQPGELREKVLAVNGEAMTRGQFEARLNILPEYARVRYRTLQARQTLLTSVIHTEAMADIAERRGPGTSTEARYAMQHELTRQALQRAIAREVSMADIDQQAIDAHFQSNRDAYWTPQRRRLAVLVTADESRAAAIRRDLERNYPLTADDRPSDTQAVDNRIDHFRRLAATRSVHRTLPARGGDPGPLFPPDRSRDGDKHPELIGNRTVREQWASVAFDLQTPGALSTPFACPDAATPASHQHTLWCVGMLVEILPPERPSADELSRKIRSELYNKRVETLRTSMLERWRDQADVAPNASWSQQASPPADDPATLDDIPLETVSSPPADH